MDAEQALQLFDSLWFEPSSERENQDKNPSKPSPEAFSRVTSIHTRSMSEDLSSKLSFISTDSQSPKLHTVFSGKDIAEPPENHQKEGVETAPAKLRPGRGRRRRRESKSLSELEFEEVKGFMDLGFVFSEEDGDSSLVRIVPGLNRLRRKEEDSMGKCEISRPYLSEAWEALEEREREEKALMMKWRFPALSSETDMKDNLRWWAHTVASTVR